MIDLVAGDDLHLIQFPTCIISWRNFVLKYSSRMLTPTDGGIAAVFAVSMIPSKRQLATITGKLVSFLILLLSKANWHSTTMKPGELLPCMG